MVVSGLMFDGLYFEVYQQLVTTNFYETTIYNFQESKWKIKLEFLINDIIYKIMESWEIYSETMAQLRY